MNININVNERAGSAQATAENSLENTGIVSDAGPSRASSELLTSDVDNADDTNDTATSEVEDFDIGGPPEWLSEAMTGSGNDEHMATDDMHINDIEDGGSGPTE